jgi:hypothetical protein
MFYVIWKKEEKQQQREQEEQKQFCYAVKSLLSRE